MDRYWPERFTFFVAALIFAGLLFLTNGGPSHYGDPWAGAFLDIIGAVAFKVLLPLWFALRAVDLIFFAGSRNKEQP